MSFARIVAVTYFEDKLAVEILLKDSYSGLFSH